MLALCTGNSLAHLKTPSQAEAFGRHVNLENVNLNIGEIYIVFGVFIREKSPWFLVREDVAESYVSPHFGAFFDFIDPRIPPGYMVAEHSYNLNSLAILPKEWAKNPVFMEDLIDGDEESCAALNRIQNQAYSWHSSENM